MVNIKNSQKFKLKLLISKISYVLLSALIIYIFTHYIIFKLLPFFDKWIVLSIYAFITLSVLIILIYCINKNNNFSKNEKEKICYDLDNNTEKIFKKFGLYITKNYIVCIGSKLNIFKLFVVHIKDIKAIDTHDDDRYYHKYYYNKKNKSKNNRIFSFIKASAITDLVYGDNDICVFNIICDKKVYVVTTSHILNKKKIKQINEMADYICDRYKDIDYI